MSNFRQVQVGEVTLRVALQGEGPLVVMVHGFPESWYSWRHQMGPIAAAGFTACTIDVRGYGGSDKPHAVEAYSLERLSGDVAGLIASLSPDKRRWSSAMSVPYTGIPSNRCGRSLRPSTRARIS